MNEIIEMLNSVGRAFVDFAWPMLIQASAVIAAMFIVEIVLRKRVRAVVRYWLWMLVLVKLLLPTSLTLPTGIGYWVDAGQQTISTNIEETAIVSSPVKLENASKDYSPIQTASPGPKVTVETSKVLPVAQVDASTDPISWQAMIFLGWLAVAIGMTLLVGQRYLFVCGLIRQSNDAEGKIVKIYDACCCHMGISRPPELKLSPAMVSPAACGLSKPVVLVPEVMATKLNEKELRSVLLHELAHIQRGDLWINCAQTLLQIAYFYNPLLWLANSIIRRIREQAVDETVLVTLSEDAGDYPATLVNVAELALAKPALSLRMVGVVESKSALAGRIKHMLSNPWPKSAKLGFAGILTILITAALLLPMAKGEEKISDAKSKAEIVTDDRRDEAVETYPINAESILIPRCESEMKRIIERRNSNNPWKDKIDFASEYEEMNQKKPFSRKQLQNEIRYVQEYLRLHMGDVEYEWRIYHLLGVMNWDFNQPEQAMKLMDQALDAYPRDKYRIPSKHSKYQHLVNVKAGMIWKTQGVEEAEKFALERYKTDPKFEYFFDFWWQTEYNKAGLASHYPDLKNKILSIKNQKIEKEKRSSNHNPITEPGVKTNVEIVGNGENKTLGDARPTADKQYKIDFVRLVVGKNTMTFDGLETSWKILPAMLEKVRNRGNTVLEFAYADSSLPIDAFNRALKFSNEYGFKYLSNIGEHPLMSRGSPAKHFIEGKFDFDREIRVNLSVAGEKSAKMRISTVEFAKADDQVEASLKIGSISWPKTHWEIQLEILDSQRNVLIDKTMPFENSGIIIGKAGMQSHALTMKLGSAKEIENAWGFRLTVWTVTKGEETLGSTQVTATTSEKTSNGAEDITFYHVNKRVNEFPEKDDFSTPESAYAAINRVMAEGKLSGWRLVSCKQTRDRFPKEEKINQVKPSFAKECLNAKIIEVWRWKNYATIIAEFKKGSIDYRNVILEDGRWLNRGENMFNSVEEARTCFAKMVAILKKEEKEASELSKLDSQIREYSVNRNVSSFADQDFRTPESAYAAINRVSASGNPAGWEKVSVKELADKLAAEKNRGKMEVPAEWAKVLLNAEILEVRMWNNEAVVMAELLQKFSTPNIRRPIDLRHLRLQNGRWLNVGNDRVDTIQEGELAFKRRINGLAVKVACDGGTSKVVDKPKAMPEKAMQSESFGPIIERMVADDSEMGDMFIDLDTGKLYAPGADYPKGDPEGELAWFRKNGIDAVGETDENVRGIVGLEMNIEPVSKDAWDTVTAEQLRTYFPLTKSKSGTRAFMTGKGTLPETYYIKTREGGVGILQIVEVNDKSKPKYMKIRYKMIKQATTQPAASQPTTEPQASNEQVAIETTEIVEEEASAETLAIVAKVARIDIGRASQKNVIKVFGKPGAYLWGQKVLDKKSLPSHYIMSYPYGFRVFMSGGYVKELRFEEPGPFVHPNGLRVGMAMDEAVEILGKPKKIVQGKANGFADGVLYKDIEGREGWGYYGRHDKGVRMFFVNDQVKALYLTGSITQQKSKQGKSETRKAIETDSNADSEENNKTTTQAEEIQQAVRSAIKWLKLIDDGKYDQSWLAAAEIFRNAVAKEKCAQAVGPIREPMGKKLSRKMISKNYVKSLPGAPDGEYVVIQFQTSFENKTEAIETITPMKDKDGLWRVSGYFIK